MTESVVRDAGDAQALFLTRAPARGRRIALAPDGRVALERANIELGLALNAAEIDYLLECFRAVERDPTDTELLMFAQANSEHCRHKIFNAQWTVDGVAARALAVRHDPSTPTRATRAACSRPIATTPR